MSKCKFCGSSSFGRCIRSPHDYHEHTGMDERKCVYCGSTSTGSCTKSPNRVHEK